MNKLQNFAIWLDGYIEAVGENGFNISKTNVVRNKLNDLFEHVAEPAEDPKKTLEELGEEHGFNVTTQPNDYLGFGGKGPNGETYRC